MKKSVKKIPIGRTLLTNDRNLPHSDNNAFKDVDIVSIEQDRNGNIIGVRVSKQKTKNTSPLKHHTYKGFKHFIEIEDVNGNPIRVGKDFKENPHKYDLTPRQVDYISDIVYNHSKQSQRNRKLRENFKQGKFSNKKSRF